jgi:hypothetical protein
MNILWKHRHHPETWLVQHPVSRADLLRWAGWIQKHHPQKTAYDIWLGIFSCWGRRNSDEPEASLNFLYPTGGTINSLVTLLEHSDVCLELGCGRGLIAAILSRKLPSSRYIATDSGTYGQRYHYTKVWRLTAAQALEKYGKLKPTVLWIFPHEAAYGLPAFIAKMRKLKIPRLVLVTYLSEAGVAKLCRPSRVVTHRLVDSLCYGDLYRGGKIAPESLRATTPRSAHAYVVHLSE